MTMTIPHPEEEEMGSFFDVRAQGYDQYVENFEKFYTTIAKPFPATQQEISVLDIGCGTGLELEAIFQKAPNAQITAIDLSQNMLDLLAQKYARRISQIELIQGTYLGRSLGENQFDFSLSVMTAHHLLAEKKRELYQNIFHALKKGGKYIEADYIVPENWEEKLLAEYKEKMKNASDEMDGVFHLDIPMSIGTIRKLLIEAGFISVTIIWTSEYAAILEAQK